MDSADDGDRGRIASILEVVMALARGEFGLRSPVSDTGDEVDALAAGINMLGEELQQKFAENDALVAKLEQNVRDLAARNETIMELSTPSLLVWDGILVLPLIGTLDTYRAQRLSNELLDQVQKRSAEVVIIDITGVAVVDTAVAKHLLDVFAAIRLLGAEAVLTGMSPANAISVAKLGIPTEDIATCGNLHDGLKRAFAMTRHTVVRDPARGII
jgi:anti-anti-sigma regulatory factor